jgi:hypothetical protein
MHLIEIISILPLHLYIILQNLLVNDSLLNYTKFNFMIFKKSYLLIVQRKILKSKEI